MISFAGRRDTVTLAHVTHKMCDRCLMGKHACEKNDCTCCCNDLDFPWPVTLGVKALAQEAIAEQKNRIFRLDLQIPRDLRPDQL